MDYSEIVESVGCNAGGVDVAHKIQIAFWVDDNNGIAVADILVDERAWGAMEQPTDLRIFCRS
jgi:hypothetical protein